MVGFELSYMRQLERMEGVTEKSKKDAPTTANPLYPPLNFKPLPLPPPSKRQEYELALLKVDIERSRKSMFAIQTTVKESRMERYTDRYQTTTRVPPLTLHWPNFPQELWPPEMRPAAQKRKRTTAIAKERDDMLKAWLQVLENKIKNVDENKNALVPGSDQETLKQSWQDRLVLLEKLHRAKLDHESEEAWHERIDNFNKERKLYMKAINDSAWQKLEKFEALEKKELKDESDDDGDEEDGEEGKSKKVKGEIPIEDNETEDVEEYDDDCDYQENHYDSDNNANNDGDDDDVNDSGWY